MGSRPPAPRDACGHFRPGPRRQPGYAGHNTRCADLARLCHPHPVPPGVLGLPAASAQAGSLICLPRRAPFTKFRQLRMRHPLMRFVSTRGEAPVLGFSDAVLPGLASDGGLYLPESWPQISPAEIAEFAGKPYADVAFAVSSRFVTDEIPADRLKAIIDAAYATFRHPSVTPLVEIGPGHFVLELFHGPTLAFKDVAMQFLSRVMDHILSERKGRATIVGATSGGTGSAAIEAFRGLDQVDIVILFPKGRVSEVQ